MNARSVALGFRYLRSVWTRIPLRFGMAPSVAILLAAMCGGVGLVPTAHAADPPKKSSNDDLVREARSLLDDLAPKRVRKQGKKSSKPSTGAANEEKSGSRPSKPSGSDHQTGLGTGNRPPASVPASASPQPTPIKVPAASASTVGPASSATAQTSPASPFNPAHPDPGPSFALPVSSSIETESMDGSAALAGVSDQRDLSAPSPSLLDADASADLATSGEPSTVLSPQQATAPKAGAASALADPSRHAQPSRRMRVLSKKERLSSGMNYPMQGVVQSPLSRIGIPAAAVPAVATVISVGAAALWPLLLKTLGMLLKAVIGGRLRVWAKKDKKIDSKQRQFVMFGFQVRPWELGSMLLGASVYGLGISYALKGWKLDSSFVLREEAMVLLLYYLRGFIRFGFERMAGLVTQYQFWPSGGLLCLCSAYLGNTLATTGYELESIGGKQSTAKAHMLKVVLLLSVLCLSLAFFAANLVFPNPVLQSGRVITSGIALAEILPIAPMPGLKIYQWRRGFWGVLFLLVVPTYFLINFFL